MSHPHSPQLDLEYLRLAADCMQLAEGALSPALRKQLVHMARLWTALAEGDGADSLTTH